METIKRDEYLNKLISNKDTDMIKVITGIRRCGKSYLLFKIYYEYLLSIGIDKDHIIAVSLEDYEFIDLRDPNKLYEYIKSRIVDKDMYYIFIDEIQLTISNDEFKKKEDALIYSVLISLRNLGNTDIYVTGSNSKMLAKDILTVFRGRSTNIRIHPLSFKEYYDYCKKDVYTSFSEYMIFGGMPGSLDKNDDARSEYLKDLFSEVYLKDIKERYSIEYIDILDELIDDLYSSIGSLTNVRKIQKTLKSTKNIDIAHDTLSTYIECLLESYLFNVARRYDIKGKRYFDYPYKFYSEDLGLRNAKLNFRQLEESHIMENIIYNDLIRRGYSVDVGVVEISRSQYEVDFVVNKTNERIYIQSALNIEGDKYIQESRSLKNTNDFFKKIIITKSLIKPHYNDDGILIMGIYDFLLTNTY